MAKNGSTNSTADLSNVEATFLASVNVVFSVCGILGNVLVLTVVARNRQLHTVTNIFISSLALADLLVCIVAQPMNAVFLYGLPPNPVYGMTRKAFSYVSMLASISNMAVLTIDRYIAIASPMQYHHKANFKSAFIQLCLIWVISLGMGIPSGIIQSLQRITKYYTLALVAIIVPIYIRIYLIARRQALIIARQTEHIEKDPKKEKRPREHSRENHRQRLSRLHLLLASSDRHPDDFSLQHRQPDRQASFKMGAICRSVLFGSQSRDL